MAIHLDLGLELELAVESLIRLVERLQGLSGRVYLDKFHTRPTPG